MTEKIKFPSFGQEPSPLDKTKNKESIYLNRKWRRQEHMTPELRGSISEVLKLWKEEGQVETPRVSKRLSGENLTERSYVEGTSEEKTQSVAQISMQLPATQKKLNSFQYVIREMVTTENKFSKDIVPLAEAYMKDKTGFEEMMQTQGFSSKEDVAFVFGTTVKVADSIRQVQSELQNVQTLSDAGKYREAMDALNSLIEQNYSSYADALKRAPLAYTEVHEQIMGQKIDKIANAIEKAIGEKSDLGVRDPASRFITLVQRPPRWELLFADAIKNLQKAEPTLAQDPKLSARMKKNLELIKKKNGEINEFERQYDYKNFTSQTDLIKKRLFTENEEISELLSQIFEEGQIDEINKLHKELGKELKFFLQKRALYELETNPVQRRLLLKELKNYSETKINQNERLLENSERARRSLQTIHHNLESVRQGLINQQTELSVKKSEIKKTLFSRGKIKKIGTEQEHLKRQILALDQLSERLNLEYGMQIFEQRISRLDTFPMEVDFL